jgi:hypothetical protein
MKYFGLHVMIRARRNNWPFGRQDLPTRQRFAFALDASIPGGVPHLTFKPQEYAVE